MTTPTPTPTTTSASVLRAQRPDLRFAIVGAGMSGLLAAIQLRQAGYQHVTIYEKSNQLGGTWRDNTYPGVACDVPAHAYTYSFAPWPYWRRYMAAGSEILAYFTHMAERYQLHHCMQLGQEVTGCAWQQDPEAPHWQLQLHTGRVVQADIVIAATGVLHHPKFPDIAGLGDFAGASFHSAQWRHDVPLQGQRIGVIGTGSSGAQIISALAGQVAHLSHFQRTPQWIMPADNPAFTPADIEAFASNPDLLRQAQRGDAYLDIVNRFTQAIIDTDSPELRQLEALVHDHLQRSVHDPALRAKLTPRYRAACKRLIISPDYYQAIQHPQARLVDNPIARIEPAGVRTQDGELHPLDVLVLATGFQADQFVQRLHVHGEGGQAPNALWNGRPSAYLSMCVPGFPNFFMLNGPSGPVGNFSLIDVAEAQWRFIAQLIARIDCGDCTHLSVRASAMHHYEQARRSAAMHTVWASGCQSGYLDAEGSPASWPWSYAEFQQRMAQPEWAHFALHGGSATATPTSTRTASPVDAATALHTP